MRLIVEDLDGMTGSSTVDMTRNLWRLDILSEQYALREAIVVNKIMVAKQKVSLLFALPFNSACMKDRDPVSSLSKNGQD